MIFTKMFQVDLLSFLIIVSSLESNSGISVDSVSSVLESHQEGIFNHIKK